jgi:hypothetical protein
MKEYSVSLAFIEWEAQRVSAETAKEALEIARKVDDEGEWDGCLSNRERIGSKDTVYPIKLQCKEYRVHGSIQRYCEVEEKIIIVPVEYYSNEKIDPEFFGVYEVQEDGTEKWIAAFREQDEAEMFLEKLKGEIK